MQDDSLLIFHDLQLHRSSECHMKVPFSHSKKQEESTFLVRGPDVAGC